MSSLYQPRRRSPFAPYDPNDPNQAASDQSIYGPGPQMGGGGQQQDQSAPQLFTPPPTTGPNLFASSADTAQSTPRNDYTIPKIQPDAQSMSAPSSPQTTDAAQPARRKNLAGDELPTMPEPPQHIPYPPYNPFSLGHSNTAARQAIDEENKFNSEVYAARMKAYETMTSARSLGVAYSAMGRAPQYEIGPDGKPHAVTIDPMTGKRELSPNQAVIPQVEAKAETPMTPDQLYADAQAHPEKYPNGQAQRIISDYQEGRKYQFPPQREPAQPKPYATAMSIPTTDGPVQGSYDPATKSYLDGAGRPIPPEKLTGGAAKPAAGGAGNARADKSYEFNVKQLNDIGNPIAQRLQRLSTLQDTINQTTPQADALIAPELLTVMAGGQGSGLRMNEAEISRIVGGRTNWESIKAALNKWQIDPSKGLSVTPSQRGQIRALVGTVHDRLLAKNAALTDAQGKLIETDDPVEHRKIVNSARQAVSAIDQPGGGTPGGTAGATPDSIKADFKAGKITRDQAKQKLAALGIQ